MRILSALFALGVSFEVFVISTEAYRNHSEILLFAVVKHWYKSSPGARVLMISAVRESRANKT